MAALASGGLLADEQRLLKGSTQVGREPPAGISSPEHRTQPTSSRKPLVLPRGWTGGSRSGAGIAVRDGSVPPVEDRQPTRISI